MPSATTKTIAPLCEGQTEAGYECAQRKECRRALLAREARAQESRADAVRCMRDPHSGYCRGWLSAE